MTFQVLAFNNRGKNLYSESFTSESKDKAVEMMDESLHIKGVRNLVSYYEAR
jgi:hypothetical protein